MPSGDFPDAAGVRALVLMARMTVMLGRLDPPGVAGSNVLMRVLLAVDAVPGQSPSDIADQLGLDRTAVSRALRALDGLGLVTRRLHPQDRRYVRVFLSAQGTSAMSRFHAQLDGVVAQTAPVIDAIAAVAHRGVRLSPGSAATSAVSALDHLGAVGEQVLPVFAAAEGAPALRRFDRWVLWAVVDAGSAATADHVAAELDGDEAEVAAAMRRLGRRRLVRAARSDGGVRAAVPTQDGAALVDAHVAAMVAHLDVILAALARVKATAVSSSG